MEQFPQIAGFAAFVGIYLTVCGGLAWGGWLTLYGDFPQREKPAGARWLHAATDIGRTHYLGAGLRVAMTEEGLHLRIRIPFLMVHRPLLIPWTAIARSGEPPSWRNQDVLRLAVSTSHGPIDLTFYHPASKAISERVDVWKGQALCQATRHQ